MKPENKMLVVLSLVVLSIFIPTSFSELNTTNDNFGVRLVENSKYVVDIDYHYYSKYSYNVYNMLLTKNNAVDIVTVTVTCSTSCNVIETSGVYRGKNIFHSSKFCGIKDEFVKFENTPRSNYYLIACEGNKILDIIEITEPISTRAKQQ